MIVCQNRIIHGDCNSSIWFPLRRYKGSPSLSSSNSHSMARGHPIGALWIVATRPAVVIRVALSDSCLHTGQFISSPHRQSLTSPATCHSVIARASSPRRFDGAFPTLSTCSKRAGRDFPPLGSHRSPRPSVRPTDARSACQAEPCSRCRSCTGNGWRGISRNAWTPRHRHGR